MQKFQLGRAWVKYCPICGGRINALESKLPTCDECKEKFVIMTFSNRGGGPSSKKVMNACKQKIRHATILSAYQQFIEIEYKPSTHIGILQVYRCPICDGYHLGHKPSRGHIARECYEKEELSKMFS